MAFPPRRIIDIAAHEPVALSAAALALFALRASLAPNDDAATPDAFLLADDEAHPLWEAAIQVANRAKPIFYRGEVRGAAIKVHLQHGTSDAAERLIFESRLLRGGLGLLQFVENRYPTNAGELRAAFWGAGMLLRLSVAAVGEWERTFSLQQPWCAGSDYCASSYPLAQGARSEDLADCVAFVSIGRS